MRILHVTPLYHPFLGGAETYTREISERLAGRGHDVTVLTMNPAAADGEARRAPVEMLNDVRVRRFNPAGRLHALCAAAVRTPVARHLLARTGHAATVDMWAASPYGLAAALHTVRTKPDVVTVINWYGGWLPFQVHLARRLCKFAFVGVPLFHTECGWAHAPVHAKMLRGCDAVVAMTEHERAFVKPVTQKAHAVGVGVDPHAFRDADGRAIRARYGIDADAPLVGYIGRMDAAKGIDDLIRAMRTVWRHVPAARLLLAGAGGTSPDGMPDVPSKTFGVLSPCERSRIVVCGRFDGAEKASLFDALDVFAMPSRAESFGIAYLEAWMRRKPVIGTRLASTACVIDDGVDGDLVTPGDAGQLAASIVTLLTDGDRRRRLGENGHAKTISRFTWDAIADAVERLYLDVPALRRGRKGDRP